MRAQRRRLGRLSLPVWPQPESSGIFQLERGATAMFEPRHLRPAFLVFHLVLGAALLWGSLHTVFHLGSSDPHALIIGTVEAVAAIAFLLPRTMRFGAGTLLGVLALAFLLHAARAEWRPDLLVYAAGVLLVAVHGDARTPHVVRAGAA
jgi:hypothetical protein